ncbi:hypothetical protein HWV62_44892, partial [Athelia sp. TMB]
FVWAMTTLTLNRALLHVRHVEVREAYIAQHFTGIHRPMTPFGEIPSVDELDDWQLEEEVEGRERNGQSGTDPSLQTELHNFSTWSSRDKSLES